jgi:hypothetical protein
MRIMREEGARGFYSGFIPILCKQVSFLSLYVGWSVDLDSICVGTVYGS